MQKKKNNRKMREWNYKNGIYFRNVQLTLDKKTYEDSRKTMSPDDIATSIVNSGDEGLKNSIYTEEEQK